jgi:hypothetical protein
MVKCKPVRTPLVTSEKLSANGGTSLSDEDATRYRSLVGGLQYLTLTWPVVSFTVNKACQFLHLPTDLHMAALKRILQYIQGTLSVGLKFHRSSLLALSVFSDADWAGCPNGRSSTSGFAIFLGTNLVS